MSHAVHVIIYWQLNKKEKCNMLLEQIIMSMAGGFWALFSCFECGAEDTRFTTDKTGATTGISRYFKCPKCGHSTFAASFTKHSFFETTKKIVDLSSGELFGCTRLACEHSVECNEVIEEATFSVKPYLCTNLQKG
jgi:hypothetical protein